MKPKFCPACGKETDELFDKLCEACFTKNETLAQIPEKIKIRVCENCGLIGSTRVKKIDNNNLRKLVEKKLKVNGEIKSVDIKMNKIGKKIDVEINVSGLLKGRIEKKETLTTKIEIKKYLCETCGKVRGGYYEAVIQLRSDDFKKIEKTLNALDKKKKNRGMITKIEKNKNGVDIYFTPKKILGYLMKNVPEAKEVKKSYTLATKKDGKDLYRNTVLVRL